MSKTSQVDDALVRIVKHVEMIAGRLLALESQMRSAARLQSIEDRLAALEATREVAARE